MKKYILLVIIFVVYSLGLCLITSSIKQEYITTETLKEYCPDHVVARLTEFAGGEIELTEDGKIFITNICKED